MNLYRIKIKFYIEWSYAEMDQSSWNKNPGFLNKNSDFWNKNPDFWRAKKNKLAA